jgi:hypothetical protein
MRYDHNHLEFLVCKRIVRIVDPLSIDQLIKSPFMQIYNKYIGLFNEKDCQNVNFYFKRNQMEEKLENRESS